MKMCKLKFVVFRTIILVLLASTRHTTVALEKIQNSTSISISEPHRKVLEAMNSHSYNKDVRPAPPGGNATIVKFNLSVRKIGQIDDVKMEITIQVTLRQKWIDDRLKYDANGSNLEYIVVDDSIESKMWVPNIFFVNEASSFVHNTMRPNSYKRIYPSGEITWSTRLTVVFSCPMDLRFFPFDSQICSMRLSPFSATTKEVILLWDDIHPMQFRKRKDERNILLRISRYNFKSFEYGYCNSASAAMDYSCAFVDLLLARQSGMYVTSLYMPTAMCLMLSWVSFWLGTSVSARLSLSLTLLLTMATQIQGFNQSMPQVSYLKAIDVWTGICMSFGCFGILESATVTFLLQQRKYGIGDLVTSKDLVMKKVPHPIADKLDKISRIVFPLCFLIFTIVYVCVYVVVDNPVTSSKDPTDELLE